MAIDRIDWHSGAGSFPSDLEPEAGGTHIGMFIAWIINNNLEGELHKTDSIESVTNIKNRTMTGAEFLIKVCDEKFWEEDLNAEGVAFVKFYYEPNIYFDDYEKALVKNELTLYHVQDTWDNYDRISKFIDIAYKKWLNSKAKKWWQFWL